MSEKKHVSDFPDLMLEWDWEKNNELGINPYGLTHGSKVKAWWVCIQGHKWPSTINHRTNGRKCPYCSGHKILSGFNDLATNNPILTEEWNYEKNGDLLPAMVSSSSHKKYGGYVIKIMNGKKQLLHVQIVITVAHIVQDIEY